jgi:hypothetical protein
MGIAHITLFLLALLLTTWGTSLILRALATKLASLRRTPPLSWMFRGRSIWDPKPESIGTPRASLTTLLGIAAALIGVACFTFRNKLDVERETTQGDMLTSGLAGLLLSAALAALLKGLFADRSAGRKRCPKCWYDMQGQLSRQCPECGHTTKHEKHFFRTRRSKGMLALACLLVLLAALPRAIMGYRANGWMGATPTWAMIVFIEQFPKPWIVPTGLGERFGTLGDRAERLDPINQWLLIRTTRNDVLTTIRSQLTNTTGTPVSNTQSLLNTSPSLGGKLTYDPIVVDAMDRRYRELIANWPTSGDVDTSIDEAELGCLVGYLMSLRVSAVAGPSAPRIPTTIVRSALLRRRTGNTVADWYTTNIFLAPMQEPTEVSAEFLAAFDQNAKDALTTSIVSRMFAEFLRRNEEQLPAIHAYLRDNTHPGRSGVLYGFYQLKGQVLPPRELLDTLLVDSDTRVVIAAIGLDSYDSGKPLDQSPKRCQQLADIYNTIGMPDRAAWTVLLSTNWKHADFTPGLIRDLASTDISTAYDALRYFTANPSTDPRLFEPLRAFLRHPQISHTSPDALRLILAIDPTYDPTAPENATLPDPRFVPTPR